MNALDNRLATEIALGTDRIDRVTGKPVPQTVRPMRDAGGTCDACGGHNIVNECLRCGAPVCCNDCCKRAAEADASKPIAPLAGRIAEQIAASTDRLAQASAGQTISRQQRQWIDALVHLGDDAGARIGDVPEAMLKVIDHPGDVQATCRDCGSPQFRESNRCEWCPAGVVEWFSGDGQAYRVKEEKER